MSVPGFSLTEEAFDGEHHFALYDVDADAAVEAFAAKVRDLYVEPDTLRETLTTASSGLGDLVDLALIEEILMDVTNAAVPPAKQNAAKPWLDMARNEAAEVLASLAAEHIYGCVVVANRIRNKEIPGMPTRGMDLLALENSPRLRLVCGEVKASDVDTSPPPVVETSKDSLYNQLKLITSSEDRILQELNWAHKHCTERHRGIVARAILLWASRNLPVVVFPVLVRTLESGTSSDFGIFRSKPDDFTPAIVRFCLARLSIPIEDFAERVYRTAREST